MKRQMTCIVAGAGFVAGCCLMQGCIGNKSNKGVDTGEVLLPLPEETTWAQVEQTAPPVIQQVSTTTAYRIQKGDTITGIAARYGLRWQDVVAVNPGISPNKLQIGQVIQLPGQVNLSRTTVAAPRPAAAVAAPSRAESVYVVKSGDTLSEIALKHGVKTAAILEANELKDANKIAVGQKLKIPGAVKSTATVAPKATTPKLTAPKAGEKAAEVKAADAPANVEAPPAKVEADAAATEKPVEVAPVPVPVATAGKTHTVKAGEDVYTVAVRWGVSPSDLKAANKLSGPDLQEGQVLVIPAGAQ